MKSGVYIDLDYPFWSVTVRHDGKDQVTCRCDGYRFPHRMGGGDCEFQDDYDLCDACQDGECKYHETYIVEPYISETLSAAQRNPGLNAELKRSAYRYE